MTKVWRGHDEGVTWYGTPLWNHLSRNHKAKKYSQFITVSEIYVPVQKKCQQPNLTIRILYHEITFSNRVDTKFTAGFDFYMADKNIGR